MSENFDAQFNLRRRHPFGRFYYLQNAFESFVARRVFRCDLDVAYGNSSGQRLDIFPASKENSPVLVFVHGGCFRALDKRNYRYIARLTKQLNMTCVLVNYDLVPTVRVAEIVGQIRRSHRWVAENVHHWKGDARRITLVGHSVGAFLVAKILEEDQGGIKNARITSALLLSGLFDLTTIRQSYLNDVLDLSIEDVETLSPIRFPLAQQPRILIAVGKHETEEFIRQSSAYSEKLREAGIDHSYHEVRGVNHYTMARMLSKRGNAISDWISDRP